ncbi:hypothetical protein QF032_000456 [Streptomyces achromogenes]|uniref:hypothetical protein n=1 Tax=Streptomyces achromogenes TaxID=67255 RepID=UPI00278117E4|nr:hypothetical protein [Streptomyces achromogenes]MDQ0828612.1 hypothetical protein [Streptomyces achromogenes]
MDGELAAQGPTGLGNAVPDEDGDLMPSWVVKQTTEVWTTISSPSPSVQTFLATATTCVGAATAEDSRASRELAVRRWGPAAVTTASSAPKPTSAHG